ncbi:hypothetical protein [Providencia rettgeri]|uniref:hypothetical protein n=1 Tax=Providencia rettgeri TaxID=587 RepID=UPI000BDBDCB0|nr:hypothetical protein [Providencia rettgeri]PCQ39493.1 hypothetical protein CQA26_02340 [Providencia rettgeri]BBU96732.1 hypothetical protein BML2496_26150 [Providencia rettgeri]
MKQKPMPKELVLLDVEKINGYLCAVESLNWAPNISPDYECTYVEDKTTLLSSVQSVIVRHSDKHPIEHWHVSLEPISENDMTKIMEEWFFQLGVAAKHSDLLKDLLVGFKDLIKPYTVGSSIYRVNMTPPIWYAIRWDNFVIHSRHGSLLFEFNFDG